MGIKIPNVLEGKTWAFAVIESSKDENGYIPIIVVKDEAGYYSLEGDPTKLQQPWYWGKTMEEAKEICRKENEKIGLTEHDAEKIFWSSMRASFSR